jgi:hypothetical protein
MAFAVGIKQNYKLIPEKSLVGLAVSEYDTDTVEFVQSPQENHRSIGGKLVSGFAHFTKHLKPHDTRGRLDILLQIVLAFPHLRS